MMETEARFLQAPKVQDLPGYTLLGFRQHVEEMHMVMHGDALEASDTEGAMATTMLINEVTLRGLQGMTFQLGILCYP